MDESTQNKDSQILNQDVKKGDSGDHESQQTATSDANKHDDALAPEFEAKKTDESATTLIQDSVSDSRTASEVQPTTIPENKHDPLNTSDTPETLTTTQIPDSDPNKHATAIISTHETSTTQITDSDANKHATKIPSTLDPENSSLPEVQPSTATETSTTQNPDSDANKQATQTSTTQIPDDSDVNKQATQASTTQIPDSDANKQATENSTTQIPDSDANKQATETSTTQIPDDSDANKQATETSTTQIPDSDANKQATETSTTQIPDSDANKQATETSTTQIPDSDANKQATEISTNDLGSSSQPTNAPDTSTTHMPDSDANKHASTILAHDPGTSSLTEGQPVVASETSSLAEGQPIVAPEASSLTEGQPIVAPETSTPQIPDSTEGSTSITQTNPPKISSPEIQEVPNPPTGPTPEEKPNKEITPVDSTPEQERKHLMNLIDQELNFVKKVCPKLGRHQDHIKKEATVATNMFGKLQAERCELKELKDLKKIVTKLKLQIPAKYRTYDESDQEENKQFDMDNRSAIFSKLLKKMPQLHSQLFSESSFCKTIQKRYNDLRRELKLCLLCFSVFPENAIISRRLMVYWWIGEGLVLMDDDVGFEKTAEDRANRYFEELIENDFIQPVSKRHGRNVAACKMHPMVRAALVMIADRVKFFDFDEYGNPKDFGKFDEFESPEDVPLIYPLGEPREFFDFYNKQKEDETDKTIQFHDSDGNPIPFAPLHQDNIEHPVDINGKPIVSEKKFYFYEKKKITTDSYKVCLMGSGLSKGIPWEKLHMLFNVKDDILEFKPEWFLRMKNVNVVFLGRWQSSAAHHIEVEEFKFKESLEHMNNVRFFSLQGVSRISELPKSISKLESLMILDLRACHNLEVIPKTIGLLKCLTHLDMAECYLLEHMPKEISSLESLQVLKGFVVVESPGRHICTLNDLRKLGNLQKLSMYTHMKEFPQETHLDALQKFERLKKLTILWGGHESKPKSDKLKQDSGCQSNIASKMMKLIPRKQWVKGSMRRMNAFNNSTLGSRLEKLDLKCFPDHVTPNWLTPASLKGLKKLYIRGGQFSDLGQYQDIFEWETSPIPAKDTWNVEVLRLKYLDELKMDWRELQTLFPKMNSLEKVKCPQLTLFPCNEHGVWTKKPTTTR